MKEDHSFEDTTFNETDTDLQILQQCYFRIPSGSEEG